MFVLSWLATNQRLSHHVTRRKFVHCGSHRNGNRATSYAAKESKRVRLFAIERRTMVESPSWITKTAMMKSPPRRWTA